MTHRRLSRPSAAPIISTLPGIHDMQGQEDDLRVFAHYADAWTFWWMLAYDPETDKALFVTNYGEPEYEMLYVGTVASVEQHQSVWDRDECVGLTVAEARETLAPVDYGSTYYGRGLG